MNNYHYRSPQITAIDHQQDNISLSIQGITAFWQYLGVSSRSEPFPGQHMQWEEKDFISQRLRPFILL